MGNPVLPPSRFGAGYTAGAAMAQRSSTTYPAPPGALNVRTNPLAVTSFVVAVLFGPFLVPVSIPMALAGRSQCKRSGDSGAALANAALIVSAIYAVLGGVVLLLAVVVLR